MPRKWYKIILAAGLSAICVLGCSKKTDTKAPTKPVPVTTLAVTPEDGDPLSGERHPEAAAL